MGDASSQPSYGLHFLCLAKLVFESAAFGHVFSDGFQHVGRLIGAADSPSTDAHGDGVSILALPFDFDAIQASGAPKLLVEAGLLAGLQKHIGPRIERQQFFGRLVPQHRNQRRIDIEEFALEAGTVNPVHRALHQRPVTRLGAP